MTAWRTIGLVTAREFRDRLTNRFFVLSLAFLVAGLVAAVAIPGLRGDDDAPLRLGVVGTAPDGFEPAVRAGATAQDREVTLTAFGDRHAAAAAVRDGAVDAVVLTEEHELLVEGLPSPTVQVLVEGALQQASVLEAARAQGLSSAQVGALLTPQDPLVVVAPDGTPRDQQDHLGELFALLATVLLFVIIQLNASSLLTVALEEKSSRVVEVLVSTTRPWQLLAGKLVAMTVLAFTQMAALVTAGLTTNAVVGTIELPEVAGSLIAVSLVLLVVGFAFFAALFVVAGAMASSNEDAQASAGPLTVLLLVGYVAVFAVVLPAPDGVAATVLTLLPPTAPLVVPARVALEAIPAWQVAAAVALTLGGAIGTVRLAGRLYASVLLAGGKLTWREAWSAEPVR